jgi:hypothetical protein
MNRNKQEGDMKKYPILLVAWLLPFSAVRADTVRDNFTKALKDHCVPPSVEVCVDMAARYKDNACDCGDPIYMQYNRELRKCEPRCPAGQVPEKVSGCIAGYGGLIVKDF